MKNKIILLGCAVLFLGSLVAVVIKSKQTNILESPDVLGSSSGLSVSANHESSKNIKSQPSTSGQQLSKPSEIAKYRGETIVAQGKEYPLRKYQILALPNDPMVSQWWVTDARLDQAWAVSLGSGATTIAIIDTGFALQHEEFAGRWFVNSGESGATASENPSVLNCTDKGLSLSASCNLIDDNGDGVVDNETGGVSYENPSKLNCSDQAVALAKNCNNIDDDGNGHVDDVSGWDFVNFDNSVQAGELNPNGSGTTHGTMVTGIAAASGNNSKGIAGVNWGVKILPLQAIDDDSYGDSLSVSRAITYAASMGVDVINLSLGSVYPDEYVRDAVDYAISKGVVVVAAAGNDGCDCMIYPANYPEVVAVGALNSSNVPASFSSWGNNLDILAPGSQMNGPTWLAGDGVSGYAYGGSGTSFAAPIVSGLLARLHSYQPQASALQLIAAITENTNRLSLGSSSSRSNTLGFGKVDAYQASQRMALALTQEQSYTLSPISKGSFPLFGLSEASTNYSVETCQTGRFGTTPIIELTKNSSKFFSISNVEIQKAQDSGYMAKLFAYGCLRQPQDAASVVRTINIFNEFKNSYTKIDY